MPFPIPSKSYRFALRKGMSGHEVYALQLNLNRVRAQALVVDGAFGPLSEAAVKEFQRQEQITIDGIAGLQTQRYLALAILRPIQLSYFVPAGLLRGVIEGETAFAVGAVNWQSPGGVDCGWAQARVYEKDYIYPQKFEDAFDGKISLARLARNLVDKQKEYLGDPGAQTNQRAWELALLFWNWQTAAENYAKGLKDWTYTDVWYDSGTKYTQQVKMSEPANWIARIGIPNVLTGHEWCASYIFTKTHYVKDWTP